MQLVIDRELASGPSLAVRKLAGMLNLHGETVRVVGAAGEEPISSDWQGGEFGRSGYGAGKVRIKVPQRARISSSQPAVT